MPGRRFPSLPADLWGMAYSAAGGQLLVSGGVTGGALTNQGFAYTPGAGLEHPAQLPGCGVPVRQRLRAVRDRRL